MVATLALGASLLAAPDASATTIAVNCATANLQTKINNAATGSTLLIKGTCHGQFTIGKDLTLKGNPTATLDGDSGGTTLTVTGARSVHLRSLIVTGGLAERGAGIDQEGGGLLTLDHVTLRGNQAAGAGAVGGGIFGQHAVVAIRNSTIANNHAVSSGSGLAVAQGAAAEIQNGSLTISHSVIRGNRTTAVSDASLAEADAGAVFAFETTTNVTSSQFIGNVVSANAAENASAEGGGLLWQQDSGDLAITDSTFTNNQVSASASGTHTVNAVGGALKVSTGSSTGSSVVKITGTTLDGNQVSAVGQGGPSVAQGGGAYLDGGNQVIHLQSVQVLNSTLTSTGATTAKAQGGGIEAFGGLVMTASTVTGNTAHAHSGNNAGSASGGGIETRGSALSSISTSTVSGNSAVAESDHSGAGAGGGGISTIFAQRLTLKTSTVSGNTVSATATDASAEALGGGLDLETTSESDVIVNSTIAGNTVADSGPNSDSAGGGIEVVNQGLHVKLSTIARNAATTSGSGMQFAGGGGIDVETGNTQFEGVVLALNTATTGPNCIGNIASSGFNLIGTLTNCTWGAAGTDQTDVAAPKLGSLAGNGGPTKTIALLGGSPAIDKIPTGPCHAMAKKDQRGIHRPQVPSCDEGAFEKKVA
jgi:hypothetical protein